jgi:6-phosphofructokinase 1
MKEEGLFIQDMNMFPEVRETVPGYLIRSGYSSALDVNFGKDIGAGAVMLLCNGITGMTVTGVNNGEIEYIETKEAIKQRYVDENMIAFYEKMGICFGREPVPYDPSFSKVTDNVWCYI